MATTNTLSGSSLLQLAAAAAFSGDTTGNRRGAWQFSKVYSAAGGADPTVSGFLRGTLTLSGAVDILLAHASDPFQGAGDGAYSDGFSPAGAKIKAIAFKNCHASIGITIARGAANGLPIFSAAGDAIPLLAGGTFVLELPAGSAALTTGSNDKLTLTPDSGAPTMDVFVIYGP